MTAADGHDQPKERINRGRLVASLLGMLNYFALFMFLPAGNWAWPKGWLFIGVFVGVLAVVVPYLWSVDPKVVIARTGIHQGTKRWDKILLMFFFPTVYVIVPVAALDDGRFPWHPVSWWGCGIAYLLFLAGMAIVMWTEAMNKFFEVTVRIQSERRHHVVDTGPDAIVRHPGYVARYLVFIGHRLRSFWALIPARLASALLILRTKWEDQLLQAELDGYKEYAERVRYKLIPGLW